MIKQEKVLIFSHENDIDGLGNIILGKIAFGEIKYILASNVNILEAKFRDCLKKGLLHILSNLEILCQRLLVLFEQLLLT